MKKKITMQQSKDPERLGKKSSRGDARISPRRGNRRDFVSGLRAFGDGDMSDQIGVRVGGRAETD